jgi:hypothetical protein
MMVSEYVTHFT